MKDNAIKFLYAFDCYLLYVLSGVISSLGVVAYYSIVAARDFGELGASVDANSFSEYIADVLSGKSSVVLLVSYILVLVVALIVFAVRRGNLSAYTGLSYCRPISMISAVLLGAFLNVIISFFVPTGAAQEVTVNTILVLCIVLGPFVEEFMFRGVLLKMFGGAVGVFFSVIITSALFAVSHGNFSQAAYTFVLGLLLAIVRYKSTSLWSAIAMHISFNVTGALLVGFNISFDSVEIAIISAASVAFFVLACTGGRSIRKKRKA